MALLVLDTTLLEYDQGLSCYTSTFDYVTRSPTHTLRIHLRMACISALVTLYQGSIASDFKPKHLLLFP